MRTAFLLMLAGITTANEPSLSDLSTTEPWDEAMMDDDLYEYVDFYYDVFDSMVDDERKEKTDDLSYYGPVRRLAPRRKYERLPPGQATLLPNSTPLPRTIYVRPHYTYVHPVSVHSPVGYSSVPYHLTQTSVRPTSFQGTAFLPGAM